MAELKSINKGDRVILNTYLFDKLVCFEDGDYMPASRTPNIEGIALANAEYDEETDSFRVPVQIAQMY